MCEECTANHNMPDRNDLIRDWLRKTKANAGRPAGNGEHKLAEPATAARQGVPATTDTPAEK